MCPTRRSSLVSDHSTPPLTAAVTSSIFLPSIPEMSVDLNTSATVLNYTVAIFLVTIGTAPLIWSPLSGFYGRKPVYLISMPIHVAASIGVGRSQNVGALIGTRILQGIGGSSVVRLGSLRTEVGADGQLAVGAGSVGDIFRPTERANAMGWFYCGVSSASRPLRALLMLRHSWVLPSLRSSEVSLLSIPLYVTLASTWAQTHR